MNETARILIVDDDAALRRATARILSKAGHEVIEADGGAAGLWLARETHPDLMLVDVNMPDLDGNELCRRIKAMPELSDIMIVMLSGTTTDSDSQAGSLEGGADEYIVRSVLPRELVARVGVMLRLKRTREALRRSEERYRAIAELGSDFAYAVRIAADGAPTPEWVSDSLLHLIGLEPSGLARRNPLEFVHPDDRERAREWLTALLANQQPGEIELRLITTDGDVHWVRAKAIAQWNAIQGRVTRLFGAAEDITRRKEAQEQSRKLSRAVEQSPASIVITDLEGKIEYVNPKFTQLTGYTCEEARGQNPRILKSGQMPQTVYEELWATITAGREWRGELCNKKKNGELYWELASISPITDDAGRITHYIAVKEDITERKHLEETQTFLAQSSCQGDDFFQALARYLAKTLQMDYVCIDRLEESNLAARTVAVYFDGKFEDNVTYMLQDTPCGDAVGQAICCFPQGVRRLFPRDTVLQELAAESYVGATLWGSSGRPIGLIAIIGRRPLANPRLAEAILKMVAVRAASELERQQAEQALQQSEERYRSLFENNHAVMLIIDPSDGSIVDANPAAAQYYGWTQEELRQKKISQINTLSPKEIQAEMERAHSQQHNRFIFRHRRADGSVRDVEVYSGPVPLQGRTLLYSIIHDITERKQAENALQIALTKYQTLFEAFPLGITVSDKSGRIIETNPMSEKLLGLSREGHHQRTLDGAEWCIVRLDGSSMPPEEYASVRALAENRRVENVEMGISRPDGETVWINVTAAPLPLQDYGVVVTYNDITERKQAQDALRESEQKFRSLVEQSQDGIALTDEQGAVIEWNQAMERITGLAASETHGQPIWDVQFRLGPKEQQTAESYARLEAMLKDILATGQAPWLGQLQEREYQHPDGSRRFVQGVVFPIKTEHGFMLGSISRDVTAQKQAQETIRQQSEFLKTVIESLAHPFYVIDANDYTIQLANQATGPVVIGETTCYQATHHTPVPCSGQLQSCTVEEIKRTKRPVTLEHIHFDAMGQPSYFEIRAHPILDSHGDVTQVIEYTLDITARRQMEQNLRENESFMRTVLNAIPNPIFYKDIHGRYLGCNTAFEAYIGRSRNDIIGKTAYDIAPPHLADIYHAADMALFSRPDTPQVYEAQVRYADGSLRDVIFHKAAFYKADGRLAGLVGVILDITERKQAEAQIRASLQEKEILLKEIHHRVKNNLQIISSLLRLQADYIHDPAMLAMFRESQERVRTMALIHEKLYQSSDLAHINFGEYARSLATFLYRSYVTDPDRIALEIDTQDVCLDINHAVPCGLIVNELVTNALKHAFPPGRSGKISIGARRQDGRYTLTISDTGVGLPPGLDWRNTDSLGMQLVNMLTAQLNGIIEVDTSNGTTFKIVFEA